MKLYSSLLPFVATFAATPVALQLVLPEFLSRSSDSVIRRSAQRDIPSPAQAPLMPGPVLSDGGSDGPTSSQPAPPETTDALTLSDVLPTTRAINIFASFTRDVESISNRLESNSHNTTLLAPLNSAIQDLPRKPWEDPRQYAEMGPVAYQGNDGQDRAQKNLRRFVEAHIVPSTPWKEHERVKTVDGGEVWWVHERGSRVIHPGGVQVEEVIKKASNGEIWVLKGVLNYA